jgi:hypothetical protein
MPLGVLFGLPYAFYWVKYASHIFRSARRNMAYWFAFHEYASPPGIRTNLVSVCSLALLLFFVTAAIAVLRLRLDYFSAFAGWLLAWDVGYLIWWRQLPPE